MTIIQNRGKSYKVLIKSLNYPFLREDMKDDMLCLDLTYINRNEIVLLRDNGSMPVMTYQDIKDEIDYFNDHSVKWQSEERRAKLKEYFDYVLSLFKNYIREEKIEKIINPIDTNDLLILAC